VSRHFASPSEPWFRIGRLEVSTSVFAALLGAASGLIGVIVPDVPARLFFYWDAVLAGEVWRLVTWPLANSIWVVLTALMLWYFGSELERLIGRLRMVWLLLGTWASLTVASIAVSLLPALSGTALAGLGLIELAILLLWVAEYPNRPFFFGIPAWILGVIFVALQALSMIAGRDFGGLLSLIFSLIFVAMMARRFSLLSAYDWIPGKPVPVKASTPRGRRVPRAAARQEERRKSDREQLDALLDQINDHGIQSLTDAQRRELMRLRDRLRRN
jgi:hypothetical protein